MCHLIVGQVGIKIITSFTGGEESNRFVENMPYPRWKGQFCKQNKLDKSNFAVNAKHAIVVLKAKLVKDSD